MGRGANIGATATVVCGHDIGEYAIVGAGSVVTKTVPPYALVVGNPVKQFGWMSKHGHRLTFKDNFAVCVESNDRFELLNNQVKKYHNYEKICIDWCCWIYCTKTHESN